MAGFGAPYLTHLRWSHDAPKGGYPFDVAALAGLNLNFGSAVTFFVGENGTGKSTLIEGIADLCRLPMRGGSRDQLKDPFSDELDFAFSRVLKPTFRLRPPDSFFLRAELHSEFQSSLIEDESDYRRYGGKPLHQLSHGQSFLALMSNRFQEGLYLLDEPESALSPQRQLTLLAQIWDLASTGETQFIIATHSPILLTVPGAEILSFDDGRIRPVALEDTSHYQITRGILETPERYWRHLRDG